MSNAFELYKSCITSAEGDWRTIGDFLHRAACDRDLSLTEFLELYYAASDMLDMLNPAGGDNHDG